MSAAALRELLDRDEFVVAGGCYDALTARAVEASGFKAAYASGFAIEATLAGVPDVGYLTLTELATHLAFMTRRVTIPLIADAEAGFGSLTMVTRMVEELEAAGVAGLHVEDQANPKLCPAVAGRAREVVTRDEAVRRVKAACAARQDPDFVIIGRTDADEVSVDEVVLRCQLYLDAGADLAMPILKMADGRLLGALSKEEQLEIHADVCKRVGGPLAWAEIPAGFTVDELAEVGYRACFVVTPGLLAAITGVFTVWDEFARTGVVTEFFARNPFSMPGEGHPISRVLDFLNVSYWLDIESAKPAKKIIEM